MSLRDWMNNNASTATVGAVVALVVALGVIWYTSLSGPAPVVGDSYYFDMETGKVYVAASDDPPPATAPSGPGNGARAHVFACDGCPAARQVNDRTPEQLEAEGAFVGWIQIYTDEAKKFMAGDRDELSPQVVSRFQDQTAIRQATLIRRPDDAADAWTSEATHQAEAITNSIIGRCPNGQTPESCRP